SISYTIVCEENNRISITSFINVQIKLKTQMIESKSNIQKEINQFIGIWEHLDSCTKENIGRAIKFWSRALAENDPINRFINYYIAFEILGKNIYHYHIEAWVSSICKDYKLECNYEGYKVNEIRAALLHSRNKRLTKEKAEELAKKYADHFGRNIFQLLRELVRRYEVRGYNN
ncbi:MAG: hypothetical protein J7L82_04880, partial [Staphylothermus sp.]|nr:hypothetical protein [Staphylothermus sp.]